MRLWRLENMKEPWITGETVKCLTCEAFLNDLALESDAVGAVPCHGRRSFKCPTHRQNQFKPPVRPKEPTPLEGYIGAAVFTLACIAAHRVARHFGS